VKKLNRNEYNNGVGQIEEVNYLGGVIELFDISRSLALFEVNISIIWNFFKTHSLKSPFLFQFFLNQLNYPGFWQLPDRRN